MTLWPLAAYFGAVVALVAVIYVLTHVLGERHRDHSTGEPYESGIVPTGSARLRFSAKFYLVAMFFVVFDLGAAFVFAWALAAREAGWTGYAGLAAFLGVLATGLAYLWREGGLEWANLRRKGTGRGAKGAA
jgi:NADH-quinone oxidoreductase subunit A